ncbi:MAG: gamma-glutamylcyclotransferase [Clostridia bacterium]|nr:gamma-glutamylcyclotransferase [Clostridia bacterium]
MDTFFSQRYCDRCGHSLEGGRIMSMYNTDCICMECKRKERENADYKTACEADRKAIKNGDFNFNGIGLKTPKK